MTEGIPRRHDRKFDPTLDAVHYPSQIRQKVRTTHCRKVPKPAVGVEGAEALSARDDMDQLLLTIGTLVHTSDDMDQLLRTTPPYVGDRKGNSLVAWVSGID